MPVVIGLALGLTCSDGWCKRWQNQPRHHQKRGAVSDILRLQFSKPGQRRLNQLAAKNRNGKLTAKEQEFDSFIRVGQTLDILQSNAQPTLRGDEKSNGKD